MPRTRTPEEYGFLNRLIELANNHAEASLQEEPSIENKIMVLVTSFMRPFATFDNPIEYKKFKIYHSMNGYFKFDYTHDDYDGAPDSNDKRCGSANSFEEVIDQINELISDEDEKN